MLGRKDLGQIPHPLSLTTNHSILSQVAKMVVCYLSSSLCFSWGKGAQIPEGRRQDSKSCCSGTQGGRTACGCKGLEGDCKTTVAHIAFQLSF